MTSDAFLPCIDKEVLSVVKAGPSCDTLGASSSPLSGNEVLFSIPRQGWNTDALHSAASVHGGAETLKLYLFINRKFIVFFFNSIPPIHPQPSQSRVSFFLLSIIFASRLQECAWNGLIYLFLTFNSHLPQDVLSCLAMSGEGGAGWSPARKIPFHLGLKGRPLIGPPVKRALSQWSNEYDVTNHQPIATLDR